MAAREALGKLKALLRQLGYECRETEFGLSGSKGVDEGSIDIHMSVGKIFDASTGISIPVDERIFEEANEMAVEGYHYEGGRALASKIPVIDLEIHQGDDRKTPRILKRILPGHLTALL